MSMDELIEAALRLTVDLFTAEPLAHSDPRCDAWACDAVEHMLRLQLAPLADPPDADAIAAATDNASQLYRAVFSPAREHVGSPVLRAPAVDKLRRQLREIRAMPQPEQRTPEWYAFRGKYLTASSAWKAFGTEAATNQLIYDKCLASRADPAAAARVGSGVNVESPLHWGQKYEPVSVMWYEARYATEIGEFGCIPHPTVSCLAASPDGINIDPANARYGRMLEIKNVVSREITGIPKKEYWIQMQLQMAVCGLQECDFLETKFTEYEDAEAWAADGGALRAADGSMKGKIIQFMIGGAPVYEYQPLGLTDRDKEAWEQGVRDKHAGETWIRDTYWKLSVVSCVLVEFNAAWTAAAEQRLAEVWGVIETERDAGFEHRAPRKRKRNEAGQAPLGAAPLTVCLLAADGDGGFVPAPGASLPLHDARTQAPGTAPEVRVVTSPLSRTSRFRSS